MTAAERIAVALETMAEKLADPNEELIVRVSYTEGLLRQVVDLVNDPQSTDDDWVNLVTEIRAALTMPVGVS